MESRAWIGVAFDPAIVRTSLIVTVIAGTLLNAINQGPQVWRGQSIDWLRFGLTYAVPYIVSTVGAVSARRRG